MVGLHFFNPAPVMRLVEVITTVLTEPAARPRSPTWLALAGKTPVQVSDRAGFIANALLLPYLNHAVRMLETGYASREDIDAAVTIGIRLADGAASTLLDLIGLDTSLSVLGGARPRVRRHPVHAGAVAAPAGRGGPDRPQERARFLRPLTPQPSP